MEWFIAVIAVAALGAAAIVASGGMGQMSKDPVYDTFRQDQPDAMLTAADLDRLRFGVTMRGYAMDQVDDLVERLGREIAERDARLAEQDAEIARLRGAADDDPPTVEQPAVPELTEATPLVAAGSVETAGGREERIS